MENYFWMSGIISNNDFFYVCIHDILYKFRKYRISSVYSVVIIDFIINDWTICIWIGTFLWVQDSDKLRMQSISQLKWFQIQTERKEERRWKLEGKKNSKILNEGKNDVKKKNVKIVLQNFPNLKSYLISQ